MQSQKMSPFLVNAADAILLGRVWDPETNGPRVVTVHNDALYDLTDTVGTVSALLEAENAVEIIRRARVDPRWSLQDAIDASLDQDMKRPYLLAPVDLQVVKACGVTFAESMIERFIEERCAGDPTRASEIRSLVADSLGGSLANIKPGSSDAERTKEILIEKGMWSQYLEVGIGPYPEIFTKAPVLSSVGYGARIGIPNFSTWNNPEPELVLIVDSRGKIRGATLGNDVNLRDIEGRSALLLGMAKDNNASSAIGSFIRLFDESFTLDTLREEKIELTVEGEDGYILHGSSSVAKISRTFESLVDAAYGRHHQYPDGFCLYTGTLFAPVQDRGIEGRGFTHKFNDTVTIQSRNLGTLVNVTGPTEELPPWSFGISDLFSYLQQMKESVSLT